jgi:hypothetical protein
METTEQRIERIKKAEQEALDRRFPNRPEPVANRLPANITASEALTRILTREGVTSEDAAQFVNQILILQVQAVTQILNSEEPVITPAPPEPDVTKSEEIERELNESNNTVERDNRDVYGDHVRYPESDRRDG